jgi:cell wall assembly regulator SMI1
MLTEQLLDRLTATWRAHSVPVEDALAPGRHVSSFTSDDGTLHVELPTELRTWWAWHDGHIDGTSAEWGIGPLFQQMSSTRSREWWQWSIEKAQELAGDAPEGTPLTDPNYWWRESWIPLASDGSGYIVADCDLGGPDVAPIRRIEWGPDLDVIARPRTDSFGQLVQWWIEAIEHGLWIYDHDRDTWSVKRPRDPATRERYRELI